MWDHAYHVGDPGTATQQPGQERVEDNPGLGDLRTNAMAVAIRKISKTYLELGVFP